MASGKVILILGAGPRLGASIASKFESNGYKVALAARSVSDGTSPEGRLHIKCDLSNSLSVPTVFKTVEQSFGFPNVVVYNGWKGPLCSGKNLSERLMRTRGTSPDHSPRGSSFRIVRYCASISGGGLRQCLCSGSRVLADLQSSSPGHS